MCFDVSAEYPAHNIKPGALVKYSGSIQRYNGMVFVVVPMPEGQGYPNSLGLAYPETPSRVVMWNARPTSVEVVG
jgi:hypothetical protein